MEFSSTSILKGIKPLTFNGEEKERNKDVVNTFLQKWHDWHVLRQILDSVRAMEASFTL